MSHDKRNEPAEYLRVGFVLREKFVHAAYKERYLRATELQEFRALLDQFGAVAVPGRLYWAGLGGPLLWRPGEELTGLIPSELPDNVFLVAVTKENKEALKNALKWRHEVERVLAY